MTYDNTVKQLNQENEKLKYKLLELNDTNNKLYEY
jgi:predicted RNase H-like nuclease (RuvC/YqgF family)